MEPSQITGEQYKENLRTATLKLLSVRAYMIFTHQGFHQKMKLMSLYNQCSKRLDRETMDQSRLCTKNAREMETIPSLKNFVEAAIQVRALL